MVQHVTAAAATLFGSIWSDWVQVRLLDLLLEVKGGRGSCWQHGLASAAPATAAVGSEHG
jgi:hypothetical protein